jgi:Flp pilus assembly pilin Flp
MRRDAPAEDAQAMTQSRPRGPFRSLLSRFRRSRDGSAAVEFAFIITPLCLILVGMFEVSMMMFVEATIEGGLREAARYGITGQDPDGETTREQQILDIVETHTYNLVDLDDATVTTQVYDSFDDVDEPEPWNDADGDGQYDEGETYDDLNENGQWDADRGVEGAGQAEEVVQYTIEFDWGLLTPFIGELINDSGTIHMKAVVVVRNEPWSVEADS